MARICIYIDNKMETESFRSDMAEEIEVHAKAKSISGVASANVREGITKNIISHGLPETLNDNISNKMNALCMGGLPVSYVFCSK